MGLCTDPDQIGNLGAHKPACNIVRLYVDATVTTRLTSFVSCIAIGRPLQLHICRRALFMDEGAQRNVVGGQPGFGRGNSGQF